MSKIGRDPVSRVWGAAGFGTTAVIFTIYAYASGDKQFQSFLHVIWTLTVAWWILMIKGPPPQR